MAEPAKPGILRQKIMAGGVYLTGRTIIGMLLSAGGSVVLLRIMPLRELGLYAAVNLLTTFVLTNLMDPGIGAFIIRKPEAPTRADLRTAFTMLLGIGAALAAILFLGAGAIAALYEAPELAGLLRLSVVSLVIISVARISLCLLERSLEYKKVAGIELASAAAYYAVAIPGALNGGGAWMLVVGDVCRYVVMAGIALYVARWPMGVGWNRDAAKPILSYTAGYFTSVSVFAINASGLPLLAGKLLGLEALAIIRMVYGVVMQLTMLKAIVLRIAASALARIQLQADRVVDAVKEGVLYQLFAVGLPLFAVASQGDWLLTFVYGDKWQGAARLLLLACLPPLMNSVFALHSSALYAAGKPDRVARFSLIYTAAVWPLAALLMLRAGAIGLPIAEILACPAYWFLHRAFVKEFGPVDLQPQMALLAGMYGSALVAATIRQPWLSICVYVLLCVICFAVMKSARKTVLDLGRFVWQRGWANQSRGVELK